MRVIIRFTITFATMTSLGIAPLVAQTPSLQTVPLSADIDVVSVRTLPDGNTLRQERKMKFYRRADGSTRVITDPLGGTTTSQYENISTATPPDSSLFTVPAGYRTVPAPQSRVIASQTN